MGGCKPGQPSSSCWFAPPHLFYLNFKEPRTTDVELWNLNITISDVGEPHLWGHTTVTLVAK